MMIVIVALTTWLILALFFVVLCQGAASADRGDAFSTERYPSGFANNNDPRAADVPAIVVGKDRRPAPAEVRPRARGARGRAGQYAARS
jgi:hypothetical protein